MIATVVGAPVEDAPRLAEWSNWIQRQFAADFVEHRERIETACAELYDYLRELIARGRETPADDLLHTLLAVEDLSDDEVVNLVLNVLVGGVDTTQSQLAQALRLFAEHPDQWALLREDPSLVPRAVEEVLRYEPITPFTARICTEDVTFRDVEFPRDTVVMVAAVTGNEQAPFDITAERDTKRLLTFGAGIHYCLGANLARAEMQEALAFLAPRMPGLALAGEPGYESVQGIYGLSSLALRWEPVPARARGVGGGGQQHGGQRGETDDTGDEGHARFNGTSAGFLEPFGYGPPRMSEFGPTIAAAYAVEGPAVDLGRGVHEGAVAPEAVVRVALRMVNRHGLIAGATGTGKTKTLQLIAEQLSAAGVPVVVADVKGDVSGLAAPGDPAGAAGKRAADLGMAYEPTAFPVEFFSLGGLGPGVPIRATVSDFGPQLLGKILGANETQEQSLQLVFHYADTKDLDLLDLADLRALLTFLDSDEGKDELEGIGGLSGATVGVLLRSHGGARDRRRHRVLRRAAAGHRRPACAWTRDGRGVVSCVELAAVQEHPELWSTALMWLVAELFETLPEAGDLRQAEARRLPRRGAPAVRGRDAGVPRVDRAHRPPDPLQGRRRLLRHPDAEGRPGGRARPARQPRPARAAGVHARRREGAAGDGVDVPALRVLRPRGAAALARASARRRSRSSTSAACRRRSCTRGWSRRGRGWRRRRFDAARRRRCGRSTGRGWTRRTPARPPAASVPDCSREAAAPVETSDIGW